jgi:protoheme IX farnesyltransferase
MTLGVQPTPLRDPLSQRLADYWELTKPRIAMLVMFTALTGFYLGSAGPFDWGRLLHTLIGTALTAGGAGALNMLLERGPDGRMRRTMGRPLPAGRVQPLAALRLGVSLAVAGVFYLTAAVNLLAGLLSALTIIAYIVVYTPLKRRTSLATLVGAVPGALPAVGGWAASAGHVSFEAWALFLIVFFWQMPHFFALAWMYREDYRRGGFRLLPGHDAEGSGTAAQIFYFSLALLPVSLAPALLGLSGAVYFFGATALGAAFAVEAARFRRGQTNAAARRFFRISVLYLPLILALLLLNKV